MTQKITNYFTKGELFLWMGSVFFITISFALFDRENYMTFAASLVGVTSLIFVAKGNPVGQALMIIFSVMYGVLSYSFAYYGEMLTYLGMTGPMAVFSMIAWLKHPYEGHRSEVRVNHLQARELVFMAVLTAAVTAVFYFVLDYFHTANIVPSTISVTTSFIAVYLTFRRSPYYALGYAANDVVLIILWSLASFADKSYISVVICFVVFLANDIYGYINWARMDARQAES